MKTSRPLLGLLVASALVIVGPSRADDPPTTYAWAPKATERLEQRFPTPSGFTRVDVTAGSYASFLRTLPLLPEGTKVLDYKGSPLYGDGRHPNIAAVIDLDVGTKDLQQCADSVIRLHAEWKYARGDRDIAYRSLSGTSIPYARYLAGERAVATGNALSLVVRAAPSPDTHAFFRSYLDDVFAWANTRSLERDAKQVPLTELRGGDFFVSSGAPYGHAVVVLDVAKDAAGRMAMLLGQGYMPAQSFHVLRGDDQHAWFVVEPGATEVKTPFWSAFPVSSLRRL